MNPAVVMTGTTREVTSMPWKVLGGAALLAGISTLAYGVTLPAAGLGSARFEWASGLLSAAAFLYLAAFASYLVHLARDGETASRIGSFLTRTGLALHTSALLVRWSISGLHQPPWTNLYESLIFFAWGVALVYAAFEWRTGNRTAGAFVIPVAVLMMGVAAISAPHTKEIPQIMPALQSGWIKIHVTFACIAYAAFFTAFGFAILFLVKDGVSPAFLRALYAVFAAVSFVSYGLGDVVRYAEFPLNWPVIAPDGQVSSGLKPVPYTGQLYLLAFAAYAAAAALFFAGKSGRLARLRAYDLPVFLTGFLAHTAGTAVAIQHAAGIRPVPMRPHLTLLQWDVNSYLIGLSVLVWMGSLLVLLVGWRAQKLSAGLPAARLLDDWSYRAVLVGLPLMTLNLVTGAIWANNAWGSYWSWDPKETWALITWLVYAAYIHMRIAGGLGGRKSAAIAVAGFGIVMFTYLGVNLFLSGLHSYGSPQ